MRKFDIVIIGGGFAGASMAHRLSKLDSCLEILLIERNHLGGKPVSAFTFKDVVDDLGIKNTVRQYYNQIEIISTLGARECYKYDEDVFALIDYKKTCEELVNKSRCQVIFEEVKSIKGGKVVMKDDVIQPKIIVDASGRNYKFRKELNLDVPSTENHLYFKRLTQCNISNPKSVHLVLGDIGSNGGWFYPANETECEIGVAERINKQSRFNKENISNKQKKNMEQLLNHSQYNEMLKGSNLECESMVYHPYEPIRQVVKDTVAFLGDNAGMVHPIHGMGIHYINKLSDVCAKYCIQAVLGDKTALGKYQNYWSNLLKRDIDTWVHGMTYWSLNKYQLNKIIEIRSRSKVNKMNVLAEFKGHGGEDFQGDVFEVPRGLYFAILRHALIYKLKYTFKYGIH